YAAENLLLFGFRRAGPAEIGADSQTHRIGLACDGQEYDVAFLAVDSDFHRQVFRLRIHLRDTEVDNVHTRARARPSRVTDIRPFDITRENGDRIRQAIAGDLIDRISVGRRRGVRSEASAQYAYDIARLRRIRCRDGASIGAQEPPGRGHASVAGK